jgi:hypothetical protein
VLEIEVVEELFNYLRHSVDDEVQLLVGDVKGWHDHDMITVFAVSGTGTGINMDAVVESSQDLSTEREYGWFAYPSGKSPR